MEKFCCRGFEDLYDFGFVRYDADDHVWYTDFFDYSSELDSIFEISYCPLCGARLLKGESE